jgi:uncharacterized membrane protein YhaH (DUF805 family)
MIDFKNIDYKNIDYGFLFTEFSGRVSKSVYLMAGVPLFVAFLVLYMLLTALIGGTAIGEIIILILSLAYTFANVALSVKRFHDINKSPWLCLLFLIPLVGLAVLVYLCIADTVEEGNPYQGKRLNSLS